MNELKNRGVADILIAVVDGLKGFPEAINAAFPETCVDASQIARRFSDFARQSASSVVCQASGVAC